MRDKITTYTPLFQTRLCSQAPLTTAPYETKLYTSPHEFAALQCMRSWSHTILSSTATVAVVGKAWLRTSGGEVSWSRRLAAVVTIFFHLPLLLFLLCSFSNVFKKDVLEKAADVGALLWCVADAQLYKLPQLSILYCFQTFRQASLNSTSGLSPRCPGCHGTLLELQCGWRVNGPG